MKHIFRLRKEYSKFILIHLKYNQRKNNVNMFENFLAASVHFIKMKKKVYNYIVHVNKVHTGSFRVTLSKNNFLILT